MTCNYTGKDLDEDTGLYYYNARWYDAGTGRFISEDPARDGQNWYVYVNNNPMNRIDPTGLFDMDFKGVFDSFIKESPLGQLASIYDKASEGDEAAQSQVVDMETSVGLELSERVGDAGDSVAIAGLAIQSPGLTALGETVSTTSDIAKVGYQAYRSMYFKNEGISDFNEIAIPKASGFIASGFLKQYSSSISTHMGKNGLFYESGRRGAMNTFDGMLNMGIKKSLPMIDNIFTEKNIENTANRVSSGNVR